MKKKYRAFIQQHFDFPQQEFIVDNDELKFHGLDLMELINIYGTPLRFTYLPIIGQQIDKCRSWFEEAYKKNDYQGRYRFSYCTKSSHFKFVLEQCAKKGSNIETSSSFDLDIVIALHKEGLIDDRTYVICNGYKTKKYIQKIGELVELGFDKIINIIDNIHELDLLDKYLDIDLQIGIRIASEDDPKIKFQTSRLGIRHNDVSSFYNQKLKDHKKFRLTMLHFFVDNGIRDNSDYWIEFRKLIELYKDLRSIDAPIEFLNIGGGFPIKDSLDFKFDYQLIVSQITAEIKSAAEEIGAQHPDIFTEFGSFTVADSGGMIYSILNQKKQSVNERWNTINGSFMTTLPDTWALKQRFPVLAINRWNDECEQVFLGGLSCDTDDYYNSEQNGNLIYLPKFDRGKELHIGFFNCGAYQEAISGYGGIKHCLIPAPKHILLDDNKDGSLNHWVFREEQTSEDMLKILGY